MSDLSDIDILGCSSGDDSKFDGDQIGDSSEDEDPKVTGMQAIRRARSELERDRRDHLSRLFSFLREVVLNGQPRKESWKRIVTVCKATQVCEDLKAEETRLSVELDTLLIENWKLRRHLAALKKKKRRKTTGATLTTRRVSSLSLNSPNQPLSDKRRVSMDDTKIKDLNPVKEPNKEVTNKEDKSSPSSLEKSDTLKSRRKIKKRSGLTEEEKEFFALQDKIEDLLSQVDCIWNEVKDDEEFDDKEFLDENKDWNKKPLTCTNNQAKTQDLNPKSNHENSRETPKFISVTDISKLMNPQFLVKSKNESPEKSMKKPVPSLKPLKKDTPRNEKQLLVDESSVLQKKPHDEMDLMEALQAVDNLCRKIIPDVDDPPYPEEPVKIVQSQKPVRKTRNSKRQSEVIVLDDE